MDTAMNTVENNSAAAHDAKTALSLRCPAPPGRGQRLRSTTFMSTNSNNNSHPESHEADNRLEQHTDTKLNAPELPQLINDEEFAAIVQALDRGQGGFTEGEGSLALKWMEKAKLDYHIMQLVFQARITIRIRPDGELVFNVFEGADAGLR